MISSLEQNADVLNDTTERKNKLQVKESNHLFNHTDKLAADHDVTVSNTMIKITYKKALKDQNASEARVDYQMDSDVLNAKPKTSEATTLCNNDISVVLNSGVASAENKGLLFHSTPKPSAENEKKRKYVNGLNLSSKPNNSAGKSSVTKVQKKPSSQGAPKKAKIISDKQTGKAAKSDKKFLKGDGLAKAKSGIIRSSSAEAKKVKLKKVIEKKIKKFEERMKKKTEIGKKSNKVGGVKRKLPITELDITTKCKKIKVSQDKSKQIKGNGSLEEGSKSRSNKKPIMLVDPDLPTGWTRFIRTKNKGTANEQYVVYIVNPLGKKFRFKWKLRRYLQRTNSTLDADQFFFGLYQRPKTSVVAKTETPANSAPDVSLEEFTENSRRSETLPSEPSPELAEEETDDDEETHYDSQNDPSQSADGKELLLFDPDLPFGWKRIIHSNEANGRKQVHIISPDGKIFRRRYRLHEYLVKHQYTHNLDRFYFGLYPKKEGSVSEISGKETEEKMSSAIKSKYRSVNIKKKEKESSREEENHNSNSICKKNRKYLNLIGKRRLCLVLRKIDESSACKSEDPNPDGNVVVYNKTRKLATDSDNGFKGDSKIVGHHLPMYEDPKLPEGWKRFIKIRSCGESAGRMEVVIVSPDGRRHRSRKHLEHYLSQKKLNFKAEDFDFTVFGKTSLKKGPSSSSASEKEPLPEPEPENLAFLTMKKKFTDKPVPELDISALKDTVITPEGHMINTVNGLMMCSGLSSIRNERRQRLPRGELEKRLKSFPSSEGDTTCNNYEIPTLWIQRLVKCRGDFRILEPDAASSIAKATKEFIKKLTLQALARSKEPENGLRYEDVAELVDGIEGLPFLKTLIPKKITFREYIKLNRPKQFLSFT